MQTCEQCLTILECRHIANQYYSILGTVLHKDFYWKAQFTVGADKNETLVFVNFLAQDASILKISVPIIKRRSWRFQNTPNLQILDDFESSYGNLKKIKVPKNNLVPNTSKSLLISKNLFFGIVITFFKTIQTLLVGGVLESFWDFLEDGHRDF